MKLLKVRTFHPTMRNTLIFMVLSIVFLLLQQSLQVGVPFLNGTFLKNSGRQLLVVFLLAIPTASVIFKHSKWAPGAFAIFCAFIAFKSLEALFLDFNKLLLVVLFTHVAISYVFYQLLHLTLSRASFEPNFRSNELHSPLGERILAQVTWNNEILTGALCNWDESGAYFKLDVPGPKLARNVDVTVSWHDHEFRAKGTIVTETWDGRGIGIEWDNQSNTDEHSWHMLMTLFEEYGYEPHLLR